MRTSAGRRLAEVIRSRFGAARTLAGLDLLLHRTGWSVQVPARRSAERGEAAIAAWRQETRDTRTAAGFLLQVQLLGEPGRCNCGTAAAAQLSEAFIIPEVPYLNGSPASPSGNGIRAYCSTGGLMRIILPRRNYALGKMVSGQATSAAYSPRATSGAEPFIQSNSMNAERLGQDPIATQIVLAAFPPHTAHSVPSH